MYAYAVATVPHFHCCLLVITLSGSDMLNKKTPWVSEAALPGGRCDQKL